MSHKRPHDSESPQSQTGSARPQGSALPPSLQRLVLQSPQHPLQQPEPSTEPPRAPPWSTSNLGGTPSSGGGGGVSGSSGGSGQLAGRGELPPPLPVQIRHAGLNMPTQERVLAPLPSQRLRPAIFPPSSDFQRSQTHLPPPSSLSRPHVGHSARGWVGDDPEPSSPQDRREDPMPRHWAPPPQVVSSQRFQFDMSVVDPASRIEPSQQLPPLRQPESTAYRPYSFLPTIEHAGETRYGGVSSQPHTTAATTTPIPSVSPQSFRGPEESPLRSSSPASSGRSSRGAMRSSAGHPYSRRGSPAMPTGRVHHQQQQQQAPPPGAAAHQQQQQQSQQQQQQPQATEARSRMARTPEPQPPMWGPGAYDVSPPSSSMMSSGAWSSGASTSPSASSATTVRGQTYRTRSPSRAIALTVAPSEVVGGGDVAMQGVLEEEYEQRGFDEGGGGVGEDESSKRRRERAGLAPKAPIACNFCRQRKLKCQNEKPCANCTTRGLVCEWNDEVRRRGPGRQPKKTRTHSNERPLVADDDNGENNPTTATTAAAPTTTLATDRDLHPAHLYQHGPSSQASGPPGPPELGGGHVLHPLPFQQAPPPFFARGAQPGYFLPPQHEATTSYGFNNPFQLPPPTGGADRMPFPSSYPPRHEPLPPIGTFERPAGSDEFTFAQRVRQPSAPLLPPFPPTHTPTRGRPRTWHAGPLSAGGGGGGDNDDDDMPMTATAGRGVSAWRAGERGRDDEDEDKEDMYAPYSVGGEADVDEGPPATPSTTGSFA